MNSESAVKQLAGLRVGVGAASWLTPNLAGRAFGLDPKANLQAPYVARLFGVRDAAIGIGTLQAQGEARRQWLQIGMACDVADAAAAVIAGRRGYLPGYAATGTAVVALMAAGLGALALRG